MPNRLLILDAAMTVLVLGGFWLAWSGHYTPLMLGLGVASVGGVVAIGARMGVVDREAHPYTLGARPPTYLAWLLWQVVLANIDMTRRILAPSLPIRPAVRHVSATQKTDVGRMIFANSITLTPGTLSMKVCEGTILVHAIHDSGLDDLEQGEMDRRVTRMEGAS